MSRNIFDAIEIKRAPCDSESYPTATCPPGHYSDNLVAAIDGSAATVAAIGVTPFDIKQELRDPVISIENAAKR